MHALDYCLWVLMLCRAPSTLGTPSLYGARAYSSDQVAALQYVPGIASSSMCGNTTLRTYCSHAVLGKLLLCDGHV